jgi:hypothetical protein
MRFLTSNPQSTMTYTVTLTRADGYTFNNGFSTLDEARAFIQQAGAVLFPGESLKLKRSDER